MSRTLPCHSLMDPTLIDDPAGGFSRIRDESPLAHAMVPGVDGPVWLVTRHESVRKVLGDRRFVNDPTNVPGSSTPDLWAHAALAQGVPHEYLEHVRSMLQLDGEVHARLRRLVSRAFTMRRITALRPRMMQLTEELLDLLPAKAEDGVVDLVEHFNYVQPISVICALVGVPAADRAAWIRWSRVLTSMESGTIGDAVTGMVDNIRALIEQRRAEAADDLLTDLVRVRDADGDRLSEREMITLVITLVTAGHDSTGLLLSNGLAALLTHPDQLAKLRADPSLGPQAFDELMRWCSAIVAARPRYATEDVELEDGLVRRGDAVIPVLVSANYDPEVFEDPHRLDITRVHEQRRFHHVGFGDGLHYCLGAALAKHEAAIAITALLERYPGLELAVPAQRLRRARLPLTWRLDSLPVRLGIGG
ncbi:cytochrome P450 family protein [Salinispora mooreana]|uniref:cytochrome P450 family protein n=1 Tax=Salinispora mooreana TaxID=999545 RepID=UPI00039C82C1|nr:cytochrome P450 [Salinispora mooreana]